MFSLLYQGGPEEKRVNSFVPRWSRREKAVKSRLCVLLDHLITVYRKGGPEEDGENMSDKSKTGSENGLRVIVAPGKRYTKKQAAQLQSRMFEFGRMKKRGKRR